MHCVIRVAKAFQEGSVLGSITRIAKVEYANHPFELGPFKDKLKIKVYSISVLID